MVGVGLDWGVDIAAGAPVLVGTGLAIRVAVALASNAGVLMAVGVGVRFRTTTATTVPLVQSLISFSAASCQRRVLRCRTTSDLRYGRVGSRVRHLGTRRRS